MSDILPQTMQASVAAAIAQLEAQSPPQSSADRVYLGALACVGRMVCPFADLSYGHLACAFAVNRCVQFALGHPIDDAIDTRSLYSDLVHGRGAQAQAAHGVIIISPTVYTKQATIHGHVGIIGDNGLIYSNSSAPASAGQWLQNYTLASWKADLEDTRGLQTYMFTVL